MTAAWARPARWCAAATAVLSAAATADSFTWLPFDWPAFGAAVALGVHAALAMTITDTADDRLRRTAITVAAALTVLLLAGSAWAAATRFPGDEPAIVLSLVQNTIGPLAVASIRLANRARSSPPRLAPVTRSAAESRQRTGE